MVQRMVPIKLGIQADHVESRKCLANLKASSSQHQDGKSRGTDNMKKMKSSRLIQLSDMEPLQSPPLVKRLSKPRKTPPLHVPTTAASAHQQKQLESRSPNYMKPTSSSDAKKEIFPVSHQNTQSSSDGKNLPRKCSSNSKVNFVYCKEPAKTSSRSSSLNSARTLAKTPIFKPCKACSRKSTSAVLFEDINAPEKGSTLTESNALDTATCSSTLKESKFPAYLTLHPGGTESEGASVMKVCPYTYCSLNDQGHASLPSLKSFISVRRHLLETQKNIKLEAVGPHRWMVPCDTKDSDIEKIVSDGKPNSDEADMGNPIITHLAQEIGMDFFIEIYAKEKEEADGVRRLNSVKDLEDKEDINFPNEENGIATEEDGIKQVTLGVTHDFPKSQINFEEDFKNYFEDDAAIEADTKGSFHLEQNVEDADENHPPRWFHEEKCTERYYNEVSYDRKHLENIELDESVSQYTDIDWEEEQFCAFNHKEDIDSSISSLGETNSKLECLSESSHKIPEIWLDDIFSGHYVASLVEEAVQETEEEKSISSKGPQCTNSVQEGTSESFELDTQETDYPSNGISYEYDHSTLIEEVFQNPTNAEVHNIENEKQVDSEASSISMVLDEETVETTEGRMTSETCVINENHEDNKASLENNDDGINQENQIHSSDVPEESTIVVQNRKLLEENQVEANKFQSTSCTGGEEQHTNKNWQWETIRKRPLQDNEEMRKSIPQKPNFLPLVPDPEPVKVDLKHQMIDERKNAKEWMLNEIMMTGISQESHEGSKASLQENKVHSSDVLEERTNALRDQKLLEENQVKASKLQSTNCTGSEEQHTSKNWQWATKRKRAVQDNEQMRKSTPQKPNFLPLVPNPTPEKVDFMHQMIDKRKNVEEQMLKGLLTTGFSQESHEGSKASLENKDDGISQDNQIHLFDVLEESTVIVQDQKLLEENQVKAGKFQTTSCTGSEEKPTAKNWQWATKRKRPVQDDEQMQKINPRKPNFLPLVPDPEPEKVDLKHPMMDERKNGEEWMLDFALRQAVTRLAPAGKRKVALLVEAFETVMSVPKCETHMRNGSPFAHARPIQACS